MNNFKPKHMFKTRVSELENSQEFVSALNHLPNITTVQNDALLILLFIKKVNKYLFTSGIYMPNLEYLIYFNSSYEFGVSCREYCGNAAFAFFFDKRYI